MKAHFRNLLMTWLLLLVLLAAELGTSFLPLPRSARPLILIPVALMVAAVGAIFMQVGRGPQVVRLFAAAGLLWLTILLGLGSLDPMTRTDNRVQDTSPSLR
jgi:cytochrome c oxidase subunit IV